MAAPSSSNAGRGAGDVTVSLTKVPSRPDGMPQELFETVSSRLPGDVLAAALRTWRTLTADQKMEYRDFIDEWDWVRLRRGRHRFAARRLARGRRTPEPRGWERFAKQALMSVVAGAVGGWVSR